MRKSLTCLPALCPVLSNTSIKLLVSPKYHYKLASEGVEYALGLGKKFFRNKGLEKKNIKNRFEKVVRSAIKYVRKDHIENFSTKCPQYMMAYNIIKKEMDHLIYKWIEKFVKKTKTHQNILDQDREFIEEIS